MKKEISDNNHTQLTALPTRIETESENERATELLDALLSRAVPPLTPDEERRVAHLIAMIEEFEAVAYPMDDPADDAGESV
jgi:hypothetical protein